MSKYKILIDYGHGNTKPGVAKGSPDGFKEWEGNRKLGKRLRQSLIDSGYDVYEVVTENWDVPLATRVARINRWCRQFGAGNCILISCHSNALGNGKWMNARGWSVWTTKGQNNSDKLAEELWKVAKNKLKDIPVRQEMSDGDHDYESNFYIIKHSNCPSILVEHFFHDNKEDLRWGTSEEGINTLVEIDKQGIINYLKTKK